MNNDEDKCGPEKYTIEELNKLSIEMESCDQDLFSEMKSNVNLVAGNHYSKVAKGINRNLRNLNVDKSKRLRLVKNHTAKGISDIKDILSSMTPGVLPYPANENEASHAKAAELAKIIWDDGKSKNDFEDLTEQFRNCFVTVGEGCSKVFFDPIGGGLKAYEQKVNELGESLFLAPDGSETTESGVIDPLTGQVVTQFELVPDEKKPIFKPKLTIEKIEPYNLLRHKNAKTMKTSPVVQVRKMVPLETARALVKSTGAQGDELEEKLGFVTESSKTTYKVFDGTSGSFQDSKGEVLFREFYFRQCPEFPKGYYFITTEKGIIFQGEIPYGEFGEIAFPIKWDGYEIYEGSCRGYSPIKKVRPTQIEINRCASSISQTQLQLGSDKIVLQKGAKFSRGVDQPGMNVFYTTSPGDATVIPGRSGDQYMPYLEFNIEELYRLLNIPENSNPVAQNFDPRAELFKKQSQKARFTEPAQRFARFLRLNCETYLFLSQKYADQLELDKIVGAAQAVDLAEFKNMDRLNYKIKLMEVSDDLESAMAKTMELDTILQYSGKDIDPDTLKVILSEYPVINKTGAFKHLTLDLRNVQSDILALDRGEYRPANRYDEHATYVKHLTGRMKEKDFSSLQPQVQELYAKKLAEHEDFVKLLAQEVQAAQAGFIPSGGALVKTDFYVNPDPNNPDKAQRAIFPTEALDWLKKRLESQGSTQAMMQQFGNQGAVADVSNMLTNSMGNGVGDQAFAGGNALAQ
jgi:hypothetical protein